MEAVVIDCRRFSEGYSDTYCSRGDDSSTEDPDKNNDKEESSSDGGNFDGIISHLMFPFEGIV